MTRLLGDLGWEEGGMMHFQKSWFFSFVMMSGVPVECSSGMSSLLPSLGFLPGRRHFRKVKSTTGVGWGVAPIRELGLRG